MQFRVQTKMTVTKTQLFAFSIQNAKAKVIAFRMGAEEILMHDFLTKHYKVGLKAMCLHLLDKLKAEQISDTELLFIFVDEESDKLASFITYGDGNLSGSEILINALTRKV